MNFRLHASSGINSDANVEKVIKIDGEINDVIFLCEIHMLHLYGNSFVLFSVSGTDLLVSLLNILLAKLSAKMLLLLTRFCSMK